MKPLPRSFYLRPTLRVAKDLLGKQIIHRVGSKLLVGKIVEVEAYRSKDPASHSFRGETKRNEVMFGPGGHLYVYFTYGMHFCANVVTGHEGLGEAVLIRAVEPISGIEEMLNNRFPQPRLSNLKIEGSCTPDILRNLTNGPAKFCQAFALARPENGLDLCESRIMIISGISVPSRDISRSSRIGIRTGLEKKWRFYIKGNLWVSR